MPVKNQTKFKPRACGGEIPPLVLERSHSDLAAAALEKAQIAQRALAHADHAFYYKEYLKQTELANFYRAKRRSAGAK